MSQHVTCPKCKHQFEVDDLSERYEKYVAKLTGGTLAPKNSPAIDVIGRDGETYQVKSSKKNKGSNSWSFKFSINHIEPDFAALFGIIKQDRFLFLLPYRDVKRYARDMKGEGERRQVKRIRIDPSTNLYSSWIWYYRVSPENFMARVAELKASQQLALEFTQGLGD